ncbi:proline-rich protein HaeIII subfamily 1 [Gadus macrocephalus]|uniref:proline-rich protein HaeIII subfamily 1 n=1 Tax=Gadus macrocephalus TaxID=80720 RepID=UPI0028CB2CE5|nr:proline-rich protein HaeIII subfamily 1 [Gadus macrocephalus]
MADKYPKSKLKRKKSAVIEPQGDRYKKDSLMKFSIPFNSPDLTKEVKTDRSKGNRGTVSPTLPWWTRNDLNSSEKLWASAIETVLPFLGSEYWDPLPEPSAATSRKSERQPPTPANEVPPFPEPSRPPGSPLRSPPRPLDTHSPAQPVEPSPPASPPVTPPQGGGGGGLQVPETTAASPSSLVVYSPPGRREDSRPAPTQKEVPAGRESVPEKTRRTGDLAGRPVRPFPLWGGSAARACELPPVVPPFSGEHLAERGETMGGVQEATLDERVEEAGPSGAQRQGGGKGDGPKEAELGEGGRERTQCCPMCTLVFPSRFSQMDCDSHLAQCLSEMNVDMAW